MSNVVVDETQMELLLKDIVETLDADGNGEVDLKEFVEGSLKVQYISKPLDQGNLLGPKVIKIWENISFMAPRNMNWLSKIT